MALMKVYVRRIVFLVITASVLSCARSVLAQGVWLECSILIHDKIAGSSDERKVLHYFLNPSANVFKGYNEDDHTLNSPQEVKISPDSITWLSRDRDGWQRGGTIDRRTGDLTGGTGNYPGEAATWRGNCHPTTPRPVAGAKF